MCIEMIQNSGGIIRVQENVTYLIGQGLETTFHMDSQATK